MLNSNDSQENVRRFFSSSKSLIMKKKPLRAFFAKLIFSFGSFNLDISHFSVWVSTEKSFHLQVMHAFSPYSLQRN